MSEHLTSGENRHAARGRGVRSSPQDPAFGSAQDDAWGRDRRAALTYLAVAAFCGVFAAVYEHFSHGVYSCWMVLLFAWPLLGGALPYAVVAFGRRGRRASRSALRDWARLAHHAAIAALTVGSCLTGVMEIFGTTTPWTDWYWAAGVLLAAVSVGLVVVGRTVDRRT